MCLNNITVLRLLGSGFWQWRTSCEYKSVAEWTRHQAPLEQRSSANYHADNEKMVQPTFTHLLHLLSTIGGLLPGAHAVTPSPGCGTTPNLVSSTSTSTPLNLTVNGKQRSFFVKLPDNYNATNPYRLILTLHALGGNASQVIAGVGGYLPWYGLPPLLPSSPTSDAGAVFVAPNGLNQGWANQGGEDVEFIRQVIRVVESDLCIDANRRFSTGFSYGGGMSYALSCALGSELRAVATLSGNPQISGCAGNGTDPVAFYVQHGVSDAVLPISGARQMRDRYLKNNNCTGPRGGGQEVEEPRQNSGGGYVKTIYGGCAPDKPVWYVAFDGPHTPTPRVQGANETWVPRETWEFFEQFE